MIGFLKIWCENIMIAVFVSIIIEMLAPNGNIKKYIKVIIGIYIVFVVLNPIISNIEKINLEEFLNFETNYQNEVLSVNSDVSNVYKEAIELEIKEKYKEIKEVNVTFTDDLENIKSIEIIVEDGISNVDEIKKYLRNTYKITDSLICIVL